MKYNNIMKNSVLKAMPKNGQKRGMMTLVFDSFVTQPYSAPSSVSSH